MRLGRVLRRGPGIALGVIYGGRPMRLGRALVMFGRFGMGFLWRVLSLGKRTIARPKNVS
jgi:hypothetical protein